MFNKPEGVCKRCGTRPATETWTCCFMCQNHGIYEFRCELCCIDEQIKHAEERAATLPELRTKREELLRVEAEGK